MTGTVGFNNNRFVRAVLVAATAAAFGGPFGAVAAPASTLKSQTDDTSRFEFLSRSRAEEKAAQLRKQGQEVKVETHQRSVIYRTLQLRVFQDWSVAKRIEARLRDAGIEAAVINDPYERGYAVSAGAFLTDENLAQQERNLRELGFRQMAVVPMRGALTRYVVLATPQPEVAPMPVPTPAPTAPPQEAPTQQAAPAPEIVAPQGEPEAAPQVLVFGPPAEAFPRYGSRRGGEEAPSSDRFTIGLDELRLEAGGLTENDQDVEGSHYAHASASMRWRPSSAWEFRAGARIDGYSQTGSPEFDDGDADYTDTYVRYRGERFRFTAGAQTVIWGRVDELPPNDRLGVHDARRYVLDDLEDRRLAVPGLRLETFHSGLKTDLFYVPEFRAAELPPLESIWSPVDRQRGRLIGIEPNPALNALVRGGTFDEDEHGTGGAGLRLSRAGEGFDYAFTVQRVRHSLPYYELDPTARAVLLATSNPSAAIAAADGATFTARHPLTWSFGGDMGFESHGATWRFETAYLTDVPVTTTDLRMETVKGVDWVAGVEFYPGDANARVNLQLAGHHLIDAPQILDRENTYSLNGSMENVFNHHRWRAKVRFSFGLDERDVYVNPEIAYLAAEPHEFYLGAHYFDGADETPGGFHQDHNLVTLGWRARF